MRYVKKLVDQLYAREGEKIFEFLWLVPNDQVGLEVQRQVAQKKKKVGWGIPIYTLTDWLQTWCPLYLPSRLQLLHQLYQVAQEKGVKEASFPRFTSFGRQLLDDFDTIDRYLLDPESLLQIPKEGEAGKLWSAIEQEQTWVTKRFFEDWERIYPMYQAYREKLLKQKTAYQGLYEREAADQIQKHTPPFEKIIGIHLHPLSPAMQKIFRELAKKVEIDLYYEVDAWYMDDAQQEAGFHLREYAKDDLFGKHLQPPYPSSIEQKPKNIEIICSATQMGQIQAVAEALRNFLSQNSSLPLNDIAIVLPDPQLLTPLLNTLPDLETFYTVHINYPIIDTPLYALLQDLVQLQVFWVETKGKLTSKVIAEIEQISQHPYMKRAYEDLSHLLDKWKKELFIDSALQDYHPLCSLVAPRSSEKKSSLWAWLYGSVELLAQEIKTKETYAIWEKKAVIYAQNFLKELSSLLRSEDQEAGDDLRFFQKEMKKLSIPFTKEKRGVQIVSMMQSLSVEAKAIFILSMNEGVCPSMKFGDSLLPQAFRESKGWPTPRAKESETAYLFYRLVQQADHLWLSYHEGQEQGKVAEKSRYLWQMEYEIKNPITQKRHIQNVTRYARKPLVIEKSKEVLEKLSTFLITHSTPKVLTPSAVNLYLECSLCFYLQYVAELPRPPIMDQRTRASLHWGRAFHQVMEQIYRPYVGHTLSSSMIKELNRQVDHLVKKLKKVNFPSEMNPLGEDILKKVVQRILAEDAAHAPFTLLGIELGHQGEFNQTYTLPNGKKVILGGIIDRIDQKGDIVRIIDYKSGAWNPRIRDLSSLFDQESRTRNGIALQLFWYSLLYDKHKEEENIRLAPTILSSRNLFTAQKTMHFLALQEKKWTPILDVHAYEKKFHEHLGRVLDSIFDPKIPFLPNEHTDHQSRCPFPHLCRC